VQTVITTCLLFFIVVAKAQYVVVENLSKVEFTVKHFGFNTKGTLAGLKGEISFDNKIPTDAVFDVRVDPSTINTGIDLRDEHLKGSEYFEVSKYPLIKFASAKITKESTSGILTMQGLLTIKGHTQEISFPFTAETTATGYVFSGSFRINRKDFGIGSSNVISNEVEITLSVTVSK
jgi:polyisoprenoid-binding protein YceI